MVIICIMQIITIFYYKAGVPVDYYLFATILSAYSFHPTAVL